MDKPLSVEDALTKYNNCLPALRYPVSDGSDKDLLFINAVKENDIKRSFFKKKRAVSAPFKKNLLKESFNLYVIGENDRADAIKESVERHNSLGEGKVNLRVLPIEADVEDLLNDIASKKGKKKILILSDNNANEENVDSNVFLSLIKIKANKELSKDVEVFAEIFDPSNRFSLESLHISGVIIANQIVSVYMTQLLCHVESHNFYEDLLMPDATSSVSFEIKLAKELLDINEQLEFASSGDFVNALYLSSNKEYLPLGFIGEKSRKNIVDGVVGAVGGVVNATTKVISNIGNVLTLADTPEEVAVDFKDVRFFNTNLSKKEKIIVRPDTTMIVVHNK